MAILTWARCIAAGLLLAGCELTRAPSPFEYTENNVAVYAVLEAGSEVAQVLLTRFDAGADEAQRYTRLVGARVRLIRGADTLVLPEAPAGFLGCSRRDPGEAGAQASFREGCYAARIPGGVRPGERYQLRIALPSGDSVRGATEVPHHPLLRVPENGASVRVPSSITPGRAFRSGVLRLHWTSPAGPGRVVSCLGTGAVYRLGVRQEGATCRLQVSVSPTEDLPRGDSASIALYPPECSTLQGPVAWDSIQARLSVTAYDTSYARYAREVLSTESIRRDRAAAGITGALGVFAAVAATERSVVLLPSGTP